MKKNIFCFFVALSFSATLVAQRDDTYQFPSTILADSLTPAVYKAQMLTKVGQYKQAVKIFNKSNQHAQQTALLRLRELLPLLHPMPARKYILQKAESAQIVIINEAHHKPQHRVFTESLLADFYKMGFRYFGLETLTNDTVFVDVQMDTGLNARKYPLVTSGAYVSEPCFGNMVRSALRLGFTLFAYEAPHKFNRTPREKIQAQHIAEVLKKNPGAKILIHCGYGHAAECFNKDFGSFTMAGFIREYTGIDPLTIDQTSLTGDEDLTSQQILRNINEPSVLVTRDNELVNDGVLLKNDSNCYNILVAHPVTKTRYDRPLWKMIEGYSTYLPKLDATQKFPIMIKAYLNAEGNDAVPVDVIIVDSKNEKKALILGPGKYRLIYRSIDGSNRITSIECNLKQ